MPHTPLPHHLALVSASTSSTTDGLPSSATTAATITRAQNRTGCHPSRGLIRSNPDSSPNSTIEIIRVPVPLVPGARVKLKNAGFEQLGHAGYSKAKIRKSGLYTLLLANCDATNALAILVTGETHWLNPYGWLPGIRRRTAHSLLDFLGVPPFSRQSGRPR